VVELPNIDYTTPARLRGPDIVATNVAAGAYVVGAPLPLTDIAGARALEVALYRDGELLGRGKAADATGDPLQALLWLVNQLHDRGLPLEPGQVLLTGALGQMHAGVPGRYRADYGGGAELDFTIVAAAPGASAAAPK
jgi:2-keto-4-pentenoate hydratase